MSALSDALVEANVEKWSAREIARRGGDRVHFGTISNYLGGRHGRPSEDVLQVFSDVLKIPMTRLRTLAELPAGDDEPYELPSEINRLDRRQKKLVSDLIRMLAETKAGDGDVDRDATSTIPAIPRAGVSLVKYGPESADVIELDEVRERLAARIAADVRARGGWPTDTAEVLRLVDDAARDLFNPDHVLYEDTAARESTD